MNEADWPQVAAIWVEGIATGQATFETEPPSWAVFDATRRPEGRFVVEHADGVVGWAALAPVSSRACYAGVAENSVYVAAAARGLGFGTELMRALVAAAAERESGRSRRACSRRTRPASLSTSGPASGSSAAGNGSRRSAESGATRCFSSCVCPNPGERLKPLRPRPPSGGTRGTRCGHRTRTSSRRRSRPARSGPRSG